MELLNIFEQFSVWAKGGATVVLFGLIVTFIRKKDKMPLLRKILGKGERITHKLGEALIETSDVFGAMNSAIKENNHLKENSIKDVIAEGKEAIMEWKDVIVEIKPKKKKLNQ